MSTLTVTNISNGSSTTTTANVVNGCAKAWVRFTGSSGAINGSYNVSSVTRNATGSYTINLTNALADTNYSVVATPKRISGNGNNGIAASVTYNGTLTTSAVPVSCCQFASSNEDPDFCSVSVFR